nr:MAG TPA: hypothetical protein [Bacteriophage sp.]DAO38675.1 MAG TPA: hypothetical protein [Caudoviricetes sp.]
MKVVVLYLESALFKCFVYLNNLFFLNCLG